jgi:hypothetical protein
MLKCKVFCEQPVKRLAKSKYDRPTETYTDTLQSDEAMLDKLAGYEEVEFPEQIEINTHVRYITLKKGKRIFRLGGLLKRIFAEYVVLSNGLLTWSVQKNHYNDDTGKLLHTTIFFKYINKESRQEFAIKAQEDELIKLRAENERLKMGMQ